MINAAEIRFDKTSFDDGFGFSCMKAAYMCGVKGRMEYGPEMGVRIIVEGEEKVIAEFIRWLEDNVKDSVNLVIVYSFSPEYRYKEFDLYWQPGHDRNF
jgi:acylphosphatase